MERFRIGVFLLGMMVVLVVVVVEDEAFPSWN
jgi:hypothetical protein